MRKMMLSLAVMVEFQRASNRIARLSMHGNEYMLHRDEIECTILAFVCSLLVQDAIAALSAMNRVLWCQNVLHATGYSQHK